MKYRTRTEIMFSILQAAYSETTKTNLMYKSYLSYIQLREYLKYLIENDLLQHDEQRDRYIVTEKGRHFVKTYGQISELISPN